MKRFLTIILLFAFFNVSFAQTVAIKAETVGIDGYVLDTTSYIGNKELSSKSIEQILTDGLKIYPEKVLTIAEIKEGAPLFFEIEHNGKRMIVAPLLCSKVVEIAIEKNIIAYKIPYGVLKGGIIETEYVYAEALKFNPKKIKKAETYLEFEEKFKDFQVTRLLTQIEDIKYRKAVNDGKIEEIRGQIENLKN